MHAVVMENLEDYLAGTLNPVGQREIEGHLNFCPSCVEELHSMEDTSHLFVTLRSEEAWDPSPGFYAGVMERAGTRKTAPSFTGFFNLDMAFGRRLVFASLLTLAVMGSYLVSRESTYQNGPSPDAIMAEENSPTLDQGSGQDNMLVTLTAYEQR